MRENQRRGKCFVCLLCVVVLVLSLMAVPVSAAEITRQEVSHDIAIIYDNSGTMYYVSGGKIWCQAAYSIEVFAAMMNEGDTLRVFPMNPIDVNGKQYTMDEPLVITNTSDAAEIRDIYTAQPLDTPVEPILKAHEALKNSSADSKWIIVITDGTEFYENQYALGSKTTGRLSEIFTDCCQDVNVQYLGIGNVTVPPVNSEKYYGTAVPGEKILPTLSEMSNRIFGRNELKFSGNELSFDVPLSKLIVFAQGENVSTVSSDGLGNPETVYQPHYNEKGAGGGYESKFAVDTTLQGVIGTYTNCPSGTYSFSYGDVGSVVAYYEPDVDLTVMLKDENGNIVTDSTELFPGEYRLVYGLIDSDGHFTDSALLGSTDYIVEYVLDGQTISETASKSGEIPISMASDNNLELLSASVTFLDGYHIYKDSSMLGWPDGGVTIKPRLAGSMYLECSGGQEYYELAELEENGVYNVSVHYEGDMSELAEMSLDAEMEGGNASFEITEASSGNYVVKLKYNNTPLETDLGDYVLSLQASAVNIDGQMTQSEILTLPFKVEHAESSLKMKLEVPQKSLVVSQLDKAEPITAKLSLNGEDLTDEQLNAVVFEVVCDGVKFKTEPVPGESAFLVRVDDSQKVAVGKYDVKLKSSLQDNVGQLMEAEKDASLSAHLFPRWVVLAGIILAALILAALTYLFLNMKVLPNRITTTKCTMTVNGEAFNVTPSASYEGKGKKSGSFSVSAKRSYGVNSYRVNIGMDLVAVSPRYKKSRERLAGINGTPNAMPKYINNVSIGTKSYSRDEKGNFVIKGSDTYSFGNNKVFHIHGISPMGDAVNLTFTVKFE